MLAKNIIKIIEIFTLGFVFPLLIVYFSLSSYILIFLWIIFLYTLVIFIKFYKEDNIFKNSFKLLKLGKYFFLIILRWLFALVVLYYFTKFFFPEKLFSLQKMITHCFIKFLFYIQYFLHFHKNLFFVPFFLKDIKVSLKMKK